MVGSAMFNVQINNRLKDIKGSKQDFGGVNIVAIGDLLQLEPVSIFLRTQKIRNMLFLLQIYGKITSICLNCNK